MLWFLSEISTVRVIVVAGGVDEPLPSLPQAAGIKFISYSKLLSLYEDLVQLCRHPKAKAPVLFEMDALGREAGIKRPQAKVYFEKEIGEMCALLSKVESI